MRRLPTRWTPMAAASQGRRASDWRSKPSKRLPNTMRLSLSFLAVNVVVDEAGQPHVEKPVGMPRRLTIVGSKEMDLRYGENPHQRAALYAPRGWERGLAQAEKLQGKELSFNNLIDLDAAWSLVSDLADGACVIIKHTNPCGAATGDDSREAFEKARATDPVSAFGGVIGFNRTVSEAAARAIAETFFEAIVAPEYEPSALEILASKKNLRLLRMGSATAPPPFDMRAISGGLLIQDRDGGVLDDARLKVVSARAARRRGDAGSAVRVGDRKAREIQRHRLRSRRATGWRRGRPNEPGGFGEDRGDEGTSSSSGHRACVGCILSIQRRYRRGSERGITAVIQPGGSVRDEEVITAANEHNLAMVFTVCDISNTRQIKKGGRNAIR